MSWCSVYIIVDGLSCNSLTTFRYLVPENLRQRSQALTSADVTLSSLDTCDIYH